MTTVFTINDVACFSAELTDLNLCVNRTAGDRIAGNQRRQLAFLNEDLINQPYEVGFSIILPLHYIANFLSKLEPDLGAVHYNLGTAYRQQGQHELAREHLKKFVQLQPNSAEARELLRQGLE